MLFAPSPVFKFYFFRGSYSFHSSSSPCGVIGDNNALSSTFVEYIEGARMFLENEGEKDLPVLQEIRLNYSEFIRNLIRNTQGKIFLYMMDIFTATHDVQFLLLLALLAFPADIYFNYGLLLVFSQSCGQLPDIVINMMTLR